MKKLFSILLIALLAINSISAFAWNSEDDVMLLLSELDIMKGDPDGNYRLDDAVSRAELCKIAISISAYKDSVAIGSLVSPFKDVPADHWAAPYIQLAVNNGICKGYTDATFRPGGTVLYEEAISMLLKILGYTDSDFSNSWPYGQVGVAKRIGLCDDVDKNIGDALNRRDVMKLTYNLLNTNAKGSNSDYINTLDYSIIEDAILIATAKEDTSVGSNKVFTSAGSYKINSNFNYDNVGRKGDIIIKNSDELVSFIPSEQIVNRYNIYQVLGSEIVVYENGQMKSLDFDKSLSVYNKSNKTLLSAMLYSISAGDVLITYSNNAGTLDYGVLKTEELQGPFTYTGLNMLTVLGLSNATVTRNGSAVSASDLALNDIIYYSLPLGTVWSYSTKVTGIYEKALPNKDTPTSVQVSGETYTIESATAFNKLASSGNFAYGDTVTLMLGRSNQIADVMSPSGTNSTVYGYLIETGTKEFTTSDKSKYVNNYIKVALPDGNVYEYSADKDYSDYRNRVVKVTFTGGVAKMSTISKQSTISGAFNWSNKTLGKYKLSASLNILDVATQESNNKPLYTTIYPQRLDGLNISASSILNVQTNDANEVTDLILNDFTGDAYTYGIVKSADNVSKGQIVYGTYTYVVDGIPKTVTTSNTVFGVHSSQPVKITYNQMGSIGSLQALEKLDGKITSVTDNSITIGSTKYTLSDKVAVYLKDANYDYTILPLNEIKNNNYNLTAYYDTLPSYGGRIRIIVATKK